MLSIQVGAKPTSNGTAECSPPSKRPKFEESQNSAIQNGENVKVTSSDTFKMETDQNGLVEHGNGILEGISI